MRPQILRFDVRRINIAVFHQVQFCMCGTSRYPLRSTKIFVWGPARMAGFRIREEAQASAGHAAEAGGSGMLVGGGWMSLRRRELSISKASLESRPASRRAIVKCEREGVRPLPLKVPLPPWCDRGAGSGSQDEDVYCEIRCSSTEMGGYPKYPKQGLSQFVETRRMNTGPSS